MYLTHTHTHTRTHARTAARTHTIKINITYAKYNYTDHSLNAILVICSFYMQLIIISSFTIMISSSGFTPCSSLGAVVHGSQGSRGRAV